MAAPNSNDTAKLDGRPWLVESVSSSGAAMAAPNSNDAAKLDGSKRQMADFSLARDHRRGDSRVGGDDTATMQQMHKATVQHPWTA